ncbi:sortase [Herbiconiux sp. A18JL235]|uniref:Sortase n=1 Tax=Herbiconiux sp. A18JL235 TaxID=3152363 RepID=A0AB39BEI9_9MICO
MDDPIDAVSLITEVLSWIGVVTGIVLVVAGLIRRAVFTGWQQTLGVVVIDGRGERVYRWLGDDGVLYEAPANDDETQVLEPGDDVSVYVNPRDPSVGRVDDPSHEGRALRTTGWILLGLGVVAIVVQFVLLFVAG